MQLIKQQLNLKKGLTFIFSYSALVALLFFIVEKIILKDYVFSAVLSVFFLMTLSNLLLLHLKNTVNFSAYFTAILMLALALFLYIFRPENGFVVVWFYLLPPVAVLLTDKKSGVLISMSLIAIMLLIYFFFPQILTYKYPPEHILRISISYPIQVYIIFIFEEITQRYRKKLEEKYKQLAAQNDEIAATEEELRQRNEKMGLLINEISNKERKLNNLIENIPEGFAIFDKNLKFKFSNKKAEEIIGLKLENFKRIETIFDDSELEKIKSYLKRVIEGQTIEFETYIKKDTQKKFLQVIVYPEYDEVNDISGIIALFRDITEVKSLQSKLRDQLEHQKLLINNLPAYIFFKDTNLKYVTINKPYLDFMGLSAEQIIGKRYTEVFKNDPAGKEFEKKDRQVFENRSPILNMKVTKFNTKNEKKHLSVSKVPIFDENGNPLALIGIIQDMTEIYELQEKLQKYFDAIENTSAGILITDKNGIAEYANKAFLNILGIDFELIKRFSQYLSKKKIQNNNFFGKFYNSISQKQKFSLDFEYFRKKDKQTFYLNIKSSPVRNKQNNEIIGYVLIANDITQLKKEKERVEKLNEEITESILYAQIIQKNILIPQIDLKKYIQDFFIFYRPKYLIGGDFYYIARQNTHLVFGTGDCTGHGVPGAFISVLAYYLLNEIASLKSTESPAQALTLLREKIVKIFKKYNGGMDIALCAYDINNQVLEYAGALQPAFIIQNGKITELKPTRAPIGIYPVYPEFENIQLKIQKGDILYLASDGFYDQIYFSSKTNKFVKFSRRRFRDLLLDIHHLPLEEQKIILENKINEMTKTEEQTDDITIIGIKF